MNAYTISSINYLPELEKLEIYSRLIPPELMNRLDINPAFLDPNGQNLLFLKCQPGNSVAELRLFHRADFPDPVLYGQITDTLNGQLHILLYVVNDPNSQRFDVDRLPDGRPTKFGTEFRNIEAEYAAMLYGLAPGQVRRGLRLLEPAIAAFEHFVTSLDHDLFFAEPLYYHNAVLFERYGFTYQKGKKLMERIQKGFETGGDLTRILNGSTPFRRPESANNIRLRSWAIHDNLLGEPFTDVTMYKLVGKFAGVNTSGNCEW